MLFLGVSFQRKTLTSPQGTLEMVELTNLTKLYYTIGEVALMFDVSTSLVRYWEGEFPNLRPMKNRKGDRRFTKEQILELDKIYQLVKVQGYTLEGAKNAILESKEQNKTKENLVKRLKKIKSGLQGLKDDL